VETSRRTLLLGGSAIAATTWIAPSVLTIDRVAAATASGGTCIVGSVGVTYYDPPPPSVEINALESNTTASVFAEGACVTLPNDIVVNRSTNGTFQGNSNQGSVIPSGTAVQTFIINGDRSTNGRLNGSITFNQPILGLIYRRDQFNATSFLEAPGTAYPNVNAAFLEPSDRLTLATDTVTWELRMGGIWSDMIRVIVAC